jgi:hypothetical protein
MFDGNFWRGRSGRKQIGSGDPNLRSIASAAERSAVFDAGAASVTWMFH